MNLLNILMLNKLKNQKGGGITPTGTINITQNGEHDVTEYATANVNVVSENNGKFGISALRDQDDIRAYILKLPLISTSSLTDMRSFLANCFNLTEVPLFDTSNNKNFSSFLQGCGTLTTVPQLNTTKATNMSSMFSGCSGLTSAPQLVTSSALTNISGIFSGCSSLTSLNFSDFDTSNVTNMATMCYNCRALEDITFGNSFTIAKVTNMTNAFSDCSNLTNTTLNNILAFLPTATKLSASNKSLAYLGLNASQIATCQTLSNWATAQSAGWSA